MARDVVGGQRCPADAAAQRPGIDRCHTAGSCVSGDAGEEGGEVGLALGGGTVEESNDGFCADDGVGEGVVGAVMDDSQRLAQGGEAGASGPDPDGSGEATSGVEDGELGDVLAEAGELLPEDAGVEVDVVGDEDQLLAVSGREGPPDHIGDVVERRFACEVFICEAVDAGRVRVDGHAGVDEGLPLAPDKAAPAGDHCDGHDPNVAVCGDGLGVDDDEAHGAPQPGNRSGVSDGPGLNAGGVSVEVYAAHRRPRAWARSDSSVVSRREE